MDFENFGYSSFGVSVGYIVITAIFMKLSRSILIQYVHSSTYLNLGLEFLATFEQLATVFELGIVMERHGFPLFALCLIIMFNYWGRTWKTGPPVPHPHIVDLIQRKTTLKAALMRIIAQILAASLVYNIYVRPIWSMGYRDTHLRRINATKCFSHLRVSLPAGVALEALATFMFMASTKFFGPKRFNFITVPMCLVSLIYTGFSYTGSHMNPIKASALQFGCEGFVWKDHLLVYWVGPTVGCLIFRLLNLSGLSKSIKETETTTTKTKTKDKIKIKKNK